jgi:predicted MPP superfamily phosphohydrolase
MHSPPADLPEVDSISPPANDMCASTALDAIAPDSRTPEKTPDAKRISRRRFFRRIFTGATLALASGVYGTEIEPFWPQWHDLPMPIRNLPKSFNGYRITHLSDLHVGDEVPLSYLRRVIANVIQSKPNLVVVTGDLVNHALTAVAPLCELLADITARCGAPVIATLGNHDYDVSSAYAGVPTRVADALEASLTARNITLLRNRAVPITHADGRLWFVGLEDLWSGRFSPQVAFAGLSPVEPIIALSHNPDTAAEVDTYGPQWILAGHTHGGQVRIPGIGALLLNVQNRQYQQGLFDLPHSHLYVSRGVGYLKQLRIFCRPEVPTFILSSG